MLTTVMESWTQATSSGRIEPGGVQRPCGMHDARNLKGELRRLVLARSDIESADALLVMLVHLRTLRARADRDAVALGLWTGALVSYARPFTSGTLSVAPQWRQFDDDRLAVMHATFVRMRDKLFAHNDATPLRIVEVVPPASARERRGRLTVATVHALKRLCVLQLGRINRRIEEIARELCRGQGWQDGVAIELTAIPDDLQLLPEPSPFQSPPSVRCGLGVKRAEGG